MKTRTKEATRILREEAEARTEAWQRLSSAQQLAELDKRRGNSTRQKARIAAKKGKKD